MTFYLWHKYTNIVSYDSLSIPNGGFLFDVVLSLFSGNLVFTSLLSSLASNL